MKIPRLLFISDGELETSSASFNQISLACCNGLPGLQLREKKMEARTFWEFANKFRHITADCGVFFSINDRMDIALSVNADGLHLSEMGLSPQVPKKLKPSLIVGVSVHSLEKGRQAEREGADYVIFGPVFPASSKKIPGIAQGVENLKKLTQGLSIPVLAVGGMTPAKTKECVCAGAYGVAAIGAFMGSENMEKTVQEFMREMK